MAKHIALLRAINVGGRNKILMADLRALFADLGFDDVETLLQSGNVVFQSSRKSTKQIEKILENATSKTLGLDIDYCVRTAKEWHSIVADNPFKAEAKQGPSRLFVTSLKRAPTQAQIESFEKAIVGREYAHFIGHTLYVVFPDNIGKSRLTTKLIEKTLETSATGRVWHTVLKLADRVSA